MDENKDISKMTGQERYDHVRAQHEEHKKKGIAQTPFDLRKADADKAKWLEEEKKAKEKSDAK